MRQLARRAVGRVAGPRKGGQRPSIWDSRKAAQGPQPLEGGEDAGGDTESIVPSGLSAAFGCGGQALPEGARRYRWDTCIEVRTSVIHSLSPVNFRWLLVLSAAWNAPFSASLGLEK